MPCGTTYQNDKTVTVWTFLLCLHLIYFNIVILLRVYDVFSRKPDNETHKDIIYVTLIFKLKRVKRPVVNTNHHDVSCYRIV